MADNSKSHEDTTAGRTSASSQKAEAGEQQPTLGPFHYAFYYIALFFCHWFGASRFFDADGDGDFDAEDVIAFAQNPSLMAKRHFSNRSGSNLSKQHSQLSAGKSSQQSNSSTKPAAPEAAKQEKAGGGMFDRNKDGEAGGGMFDRNKDGEVNIVDLFESDVEQIEGGPSQGEELAILQAYSSGQLKPWFVVVQTLLTFGLWFVMALVSSTQDGTDFLQAKAGLASFDEELFDLRVTTDCEDQRFEVWRWFTYQWTHIGISHVGMNTVLLILFGIPLEGVHGSLRLFLMFNIGVLGGACCTFVSDVSSPVVGMSGGDYALMGMTLADLVMNWAQKKFRKPTLFLVLFLATCDILVYNAGSAENVSHSGHFGGYVAGTLIGMVAGYNYSWTGLERKLQAAAFIIGACCLAFTLTWSFAQWPPRTLWTPADAISCWHRAVWNTSTYGADWVCVRCSDDPCINSITGSNAYMEKVSADWCDDYPS